MEKQAIVEAIKKLRENEKRKFTQTVDLIINLRGFDIKKESVNLFLNIPHKIREVKIAAFLDKRHDLIETIPKSDFEKYKDKKKMKKLIRDYDFFIAPMKLMPLVASNFGRFLGPVGKMPNPQLGIIKEESESEIKDVLKKFDRVIRVKSKEASLKFPIGKESMTDEEISDNIENAYNHILNTLPKKKENIKSVMIKLTMTKPVRIQY